MIPENYINLQTEKKIFRIILILNMNCMEAIDIKYSIQKITPQVIITTYIYKYINIYIYIFIQWEFSTTVDLFYLLIDQSIDRCKISIEKIECNELHELNNNNNSNISTGKRAFSCLQH